MMGRIVWTTFYGKLRQFCRARWCALGDVVFWLTTLSWFDAHRFDFAVYDLSFEVPPSTLVSDFRALINNETLSDVTFLVEGYSVYAHKLMLMRYVSLAFTLPSSLTDRLILFLWNRQVLLLSCVIFEWYARIPRTNHSNGTSTWNSLTNVLFPYDEQLNFALSRLFLYRFPIPSSWPF
jgi:hypothetical protein